MKIALGSLDCLTMLLVVVPDDVPDTPVAPYLIPASGCQLSASHCRLPSWNTCRPPVKLPTLASVMVCSGVEGIMGL